jgi:hypothetical protein
MSGYAEQRPQQPSACVCYPVLLLMPWLAHLPWAIYVYVSSVHPEVALSDVPHMHSYTLWETAIHKSSTSRPQQAVHRGHPQGATPVHRPSLAGKVHRMDVMLWMAYTTSGWTCGYAQQASNQCQYVTYLSIITI